MLNRSFLITALLVAGGCAAPHVAQDTSVYEAVSTEPVIIHMGLGGVT